MVTTITKKSKGHSTSKSTKYRSRLEERVAALLPPTAEYESNKLEYIVPASKHKYLTDFKLRDGVFIEVKGRLLASERKKYILVQEQNPDITLLFFFDKANNKIYKGSPTTYAEWAEKHGFKWTDTKLGLPKEWL
jgi:hypothetical protein